MRENDARILNVDPAIVGIKAKSSEGVGPIGLGEAAEAHAVALISRSAAPKLM